MIGSAMMASMLPPARCRTRTIRAAGAAAVSITLAAAAWADGPGGPVRAGRAAYGDWRADAPGVIRRITSADLVEPYAGAVAAHVARLGPSPPAARLHVPAGLTVTLFAGDLTGPRLARTAPNGDLFVAETGAGRIRVLRAAAGAGGALARSVFAARMDAPFGIAFYPPGPEPQWVYVAQRNSIVRFPYRNGDLSARAAPATVVARLAATTAGHSTRDVAFSSDGRRMFVSVGSASNVAEGLTRRAAQDLAQWEAAHAPGAAWGDETGRADVLAFTAEGVPQGVFATGIRNCVGLAVQPRTGDLWCATNERDGLGDDLPPDYVTRVHESEFFGWPWYYIGAHEDPRHKGERPDLAHRITLPDVLLQPHSAPLEMSFYDPPPGGAQAFPEEYRGDAFVALHGSWNRSTPTGYKVVRIRLREGVPTGEYEDFLTGFVEEDNRVLGRPVGVAVARDGALWVTDDAGGAIWRIAGTGQR
jgi:glucose/arabinose dehydrogenase